MANYREEHIRNNRRLARQVVGAAALLLALIGLFTVLGWIVNIGRSIPFVILMLAIAPFTRLIVGKAFGTTATIVPLVVAAAPFVARMVEQSLN